MRVARYEGDYRRDVADCVKVGAAGELTSWQIIPRSRAERARLCVSYEEDARVMLERVRESRAACHRLPRREQLALYARGSCASEEGRRLSVTRSPTDEELRE
jgi:hypothetical protein